MKGRQKKSETVIGLGSVFEGFLKVQGRLKIEGTYRGPVSVSDHVFLAEGGLLEGELKSKRATLAGTLKGNVSSKEEVKILSTGHVKGIIETDRFSVQNGGVSQGAINITGRGSSTE